MTWSREERLRRLQAQQTFDPRAAGCIALVLAAAAALVLYFLAKALFFPAEPSDNLLDGILPPTSEIPISLSGSVVGPCPLLSTVEYGAIEDDAGRKIGDAYLYGPLNGVERSGASCVVDFDTDSAVPNLPLYVLTVGDFSVELPLPDDPPVGYVGTVTLTERTAE